RRPRTMPSSPLEDVLRYVRRVCKIPAFANLTDRELLERFLSRREEHAFACLVERHGAMVFRVCRRVVSNTHEAEDALQATFLVLVRRAGFIRRKSSLASWLYGVAERIALKARAQAAARRHREMEAAHMRDLQPKGESSRLELRTVIEEEV